MGEIFARTLPPRRTTCAPAPRRDFVRADLHASSFDTSYTPTPTAACSTLDSLSISSSRRVSGIAPGYLARGRPQAPSRDSSDRLITSYARGLAGVGVRHAK